MNRKETLRRDKQQAKQQRADEVAKAAETETTPIARRPDPKTALREGVAQATVFTSHALEMKTAKAHRMAAKAHRDVARAHEALARRKP